MGIKIFNLGLSRTGTKSLNKALSLLGYNCIHFPEPRQLFDDRFDGAGDIPVVLFLEQILQWYPPEDLRLIYTCRQTRSWLNSCQKHFTPTSKYLHNFYRRQLFGSFVPTRTDLLRVKHSLENRIKLLEIPVLKLPVESNQKAELLCNFLEKPLLPYHYPWEL